MEVVDFQHEFPVFNQTFYDGGEFLFAFGVCASAYHLGPTVFAVAGAFFETIAVLVCGDYTGTMGFLQ